MIKVLLGKLGRFIFSYNADVYLINLPITKMEGNDEGIIKSRKIFLDYINSLSKISHTEYFVDIKESVTYYILSTTSNRVFLTPLLYEIFAYSKTKNNKNFSYKYSKLIFKNKEILKFKVKCYGKR